MKKNDVNEVFTVINRKHMNPQNVMIELKIYNGNEEVYFYEQVVLQSLKELIETGEESISKNRTTQIDQYKNNELTRFTS